MAKIKLAYTPETISEQEGLEFIIPLYQRLFEWGEEQINQLLNDLHAAFNVGKDAPYYIGMLTAKDTGKAKELVDGQQRFTAMTLLAIHFKWNDFLLLKGTSAYSRLQFVARDEDKRYLMKKITGESFEIDEYKNDNMEKALGYIDAYLGKLPEMEQKDFENYIFHNLTFFLSELPREYSSQELNTYFERMNTSGKSLENYEILKVEVLKKLNTDYELYTMLWNAVSQMDKKMIRKHQGEELDKLRGRYLDAIICAMESRDMDKTIEIHNARFDENYDNSDDENSDTFVSESILEIKPSSENPYKRIKRRTDEHAMLTFPELLLQVLYICLGCSIKETEIHTTEFFDVRKLGTTFKWAFENKKLDAKVFMDKLVLNRLIMDYFLIRVDDEDEEPYPFEQYKSDNEMMKSRVKQYQCMLYAASSAMTYYMWLPEILLYLDEYVRNNRNLGIPADDFLKKLKEVDNKWHPESGLEEQYLTYQAIDRYWFWRIDYYLWENREKYFSSQAERETAANYIFRRNRSIEHIAPQHPSNEYGDQNRFYWDDEEHPENAVYRDCLGNMVMISSGQNSTLTNSCYEVKEAVMKRYCDGLGNGRVESLKMLYVYSHYEKWSIENIEDHCDFSIKLLHETYQE